MLIVDSREKKNQHILDYFDRLGEQYQIRALSTGDYMEADGNITIDRKQDLQELAGNICTKDHRFWREARRSHEEGLKMIVLIEHGGQIRTMNDVKGWSSKYSKVSGRRLYEEMFRIHVAYQVEFLFCDKGSTGKRILEILRG